MKKLILLLTLIAFSRIGYGQNYWVELKYPMSGILGKPVKDINKGDPIWEPFNENSEIKFNTYVSADNITDYSNKFRSFILQFLQTDKTKIKEVSVRKLVVRSIDIKSIEKMNQGMQYVYEGLTADTVTVKISLRRNANIDIDKIAEAITDKLNQKSTEAVKKIIPFLDSASVSIKDSLTYKMVIANPNVYYKVRFVEFSGIGTQRKAWYDKKWLIFPKNKIVNQTTTLKVDPTGINSQTDAIHPEFWGKNDNENVKFKIVLKSVNNDLRLYIFGRLADFQGNWTQIKEIPFEIEDGMKVWVLDRELVYSFVHSGVTKKVYVKVTAKQTGPKEIQIINWQNNRSSLNQAYTYMQYPEVNFIYRR